MRPFAVWLAGFLTLVATFSGVYHLYLRQHPRRVLVAVDSSFPMTTVWGQLPGVLDDLQQRRYTVFALVTDKARLHGWQARLSLGSVTPYAPRDLARLLEHGRDAELAAADAVYVVTNAADLADLQAPRGWHVLRLYPLAP